MNAQHTPRNIGDFADHFANCAETLTVGMTNGHYRVVKSTVINGRNHDKPVDGLIFKSVRAARVHLSNLKAIAKATGA